MVRRAGCVAWFSLTLSAAACSPAFGAGARIPVHLPRADIEGAVAGPVFAGDAVAWGRRAGAHYDVSVHRLSGGPPEVVRVSPNLKGAGWSLFGATLAASD